MSFILPVPSLPFASLLPLLWFFFLFTWFVIHLTHSHSFLYLYFSILPPSPPSLSPSPCDVSFPCTPLYYTLSYCTVLTWHDSTCPNVTALSAAEVRMIDWEHRRVSRKKGREDALLTQNLGRCGPIILFFCFALLCLALPCLILPYLTLSSLTYPTLVSSCDMQSRSSLIFSAVFKFLVLAFPPSPCLFHSLSLLILLFIVIWFSLLLLHFFLLLLLFLLFLLAFFLPPLLSLLVFLLPLLQCVMWWERSTWTVQKTKKDGS